MNVVLLIHYKSIEQIDISPMGELRGPSLLRLFDVPCVSRLTSQAHPNAEAYCVAQSFAILSSVGLTTRELTGHLFVRKTARTSVVFNGILVDNTLGGFESVVAAVSRTFVRVHSPPGGNGTKGLPFDEEERVHLQPDIDKGIIPRHLVEALSSLSQTSGDKDSAGGAALSTMDEVEEQSIIFNQQALPHHVNSGDHLDHALLLALAHDAAALARAGSATHGVAAGPPETATSGSVEYLAPGVCGDELSCHAAASGLSSSVRTGKGKLCSAAWGWGNSNAVA